jgi:lipopolysaccharide export LptBFGC system permease protein LptF
MSADHPSNSIQTRYLLMGIMLAVIAWGVLHAVGAVGFNGNPWRGAIVIASSAAFVGLWWLLLAGRRPRGSEGSEKFRP